MVYRGNIFPLNERRWKCRR